MGTVIAQDSKGKWVQFTADTQSVEADAIPSGGAAASGGLSTATTALTAAQINHLFSAPLTLMAAPGAGKAIIPVFVEFYNHVGSIPFGSENAEAGNLILMYGGVTGQPIVGDAATFESAVSSTLSALIYSGSFSSGSVPSNANQPGVRITIAPTPYSAISDQPIVVANNTDDYADYGAVLTSGITSGNAGSGYASGDTGTIGGSYGAGAAYHVDTVSGGGAVATYHLTANGFGYKVGVTGNATATGGAQAGSGTGFQVDINSVTPGNGSGFITITYKLVTLP